MVGFFTKIILDLPNDLQTLVSVDLFKRMVVISTSFEVVWYMVLRWSFAIEVGYPKPSAKEACKHVWTGT